MLNIGILCGGSGTRLWPLSRKNVPKQFFKLISEYTMFQETINRIKNLEYNNLFIICNKDYRFLIEKQLQEINIKNYTLILEPLKKNTAPAILSIAKYCDINSNLLILSSDHIWDNNKFITMINKAQEIICEGTVVFGINPIYPETGYGYIKYDGNNLLKFIEKPNLSKAIEYLDKGNYLWNSGCFLFNVKRLLHEFEVNALDIYNDINLTLANSELKNNIIELDEQHFKQVRNESIDYAIMEKLVDCKVINYDGNWSDIGSFQSLYEYFKKDEFENVIQSEAQIIDTNNCFIKSNDKNKMISCIGVNNLAIIDTEDVLLVCDKNRSQDVKKMVNKLKEKKKSELEFHTKVYRPWGWYHNINGDDYSGYKVKRICVYPHKRLSLQSHDKRAEHWVIIKGKAKVTVGKDTHILSSNNSVYIPTGVLHRVENIGNENMEFIETQIGNYLGEDDIKRYEDDFGRI